jgi:hypothetical protein
MQTFQPYLAQIHPTVRLPVDCENERTGWPADAPALRRCVRHGELKVVFTLHYVGHTEGERSSVPHPGQLSKVVLFRRTAPLATISCNLLLKVRCADHIDRLWAVRRQVAISRRVPLSWVVRVTRTPGWATEVESPASMAARAGMARANESAAARPSPAATVKIFP